jgi:hypothetical protein
VAFCTRETPNVWRASKHRNGVVALSMGCCTLDAMKTYSASKADQMHAQCHLTQVALLSPASLPHRCALAEACIKC